MFICAVGTVGTTNGAYGYILGNSDKLLLEFGRDRDDVVALDGVDVDANGTFKVVKLGILGMLGVTMVPAELDRPNGIDPDPRARSGKIFCNADPPCCNGCP